MPSCLRLRHNAAGDQRDGTVSGAACELLTDAFSIKRLKLFNFVEELFRVLLGCCRCIRVLTAQYRQPQAAVLHY